MEFQNPAMNCGCACARGGGSWTAAFSWPCREREGVSARKLRAHYVVLCRMHLRPQCQPPTICGVGRADGLRVVTQSLRPANKKEGLRRFLCPVEEAERGTPSRSHSWRFVRDTCLTNSRSLSYMLEQNILIRSSAVSFSN